MNQDVIQLFLVFVSVFQVTCLIYIAKALGKIEKNHHQQKFISDVQQDANIQNDLEKRLLDIQNARYARSYPPLINRKR